MGYLSLINKVRGISVISKSLKGYLSFLYTQGISVNISSKLLGLYYAYLEIKWSAAVTKPR